MAPVCDDVNHLPKEVRAVAGSPKNYFESICADNMDFDSYDYTILRNTEDVFEIWMEKRE